MNANLQSTVLIVDDASESLTVLSNLLLPHYRVLVATSGEVGLRLATSSPKPDLILLDVMMPGQDGYAVLASLRNNPATADIAVIFLTALAEPQDVERGLRLGAADYITKPFIPLVVLARVRTQLEAKQARDWMKNQNTLLEAEIARRMAENDLTQRVSIRALAHLAETRDLETGKHILRTQAYVQQLALGLQLHPRFANALTPHGIEMLSRSAPLHDIGKVGIPDHILLKQGRLTPAEVAIMRTHAKLGSDAIELAERDIDRPLPFLSVAKEIAHWHHEKWDGSGYPDGLAGDTIPVAARIMALADVFDALISTRTYKPGLPYAQAHDIIMAGRGLHFDPDITDAFATGFAGFESIANTYRESTWPASPA
jgi:putative two-component system response regulator